MKERTYIQASCSLFVIVGLLHLIRFLNGWDVVIGPWNLPVWLSGVAVVLLGFLVYSAMNLLGKKKRT